MTNVTRIYMGKANCGYKSFTQHSYKVTTGYFSEKSLTDGTVSFVYKKHGMPGLSLKA